jgi:hypothetical protein
VELLDGPTCINLLIVLKKSGHFQVSYKNPTLGFCKHIGIFMQINGMELLEAWPTLGFCVNWVQVCWIMGRIGIVSKLWNIDIRIWLDWI